MTEPLSVCFIGHGMHAERIKKILTNLQVHYRLVEFDRNIDLKEQEYISDVDAVFITSPNDTHATYLRDLSNGYDGYIYCEKPPLNQESDLPIFDKIDQEKVFFGFNYRYSPLHQILAKLAETFSLGPLVNSRIHCSYPFAVKDEYRTSWKSDTTRSPLGVVENLGVHFIDLSVSLLGDVQTVSSSLQTLMKGQDAVDTATIMLTHRTGNTSTIFVSYATAYFSDMYFCFEKGDVHHDGVKIDVYSPRETFNSVGLSERPPLAFSKQLSATRLYEDSLRECVSNFINVVQAGGTFPPELVERSKEVVSAMLLTSKA